MTAFSQSTLGQLRALVGPRPLLCPCVRIVLEQPDGAILLHARADFAGMWGLPGGHIEIGESAEQAARREIQEETGLVPGALHPFGHASDPKVEIVTLPNGDVCHYQAVLFHCRQFQGKMRADPLETPELRWIGLDADPLPPMMPHVRATVEAFRRYRAGAGFQLL
ncbi:NUDIX domain-containing protein [Bordetella sp. H567]|uniref:NUDIX domain-containing protein n=1 Tax=Bordetella sp. H567 TaxID=1697043 RepID=UPI00082EAFD6|nr:NUDIX domain-containing protein [Bordetella sp. H567]